MTIRYSKWTRYSLGAAVGFVATAASMHAFAISTCHHLGGSVTTFGWSCEIPRCLDEYPLWNYAPIELGAIILIFVGVPIGLFTTTTAGRLFGEEKDDG